MSERIKKTDAMYAKCPTSEHLRQWITCPIDDDQTQEILNHITTCQQCEGVVERLEAEHPPVMRALGELASDAEQIPAAELSRILASIDKLPDLRDGSNRKERPLPRKTIRSYELRALIGSGGMGDVFSAYHPELDRLVAIKLLPPHRHGSTKDIDRFRRERKALAGLDHPNIVRAIDAGEEEGIDFLVMELVDGVDANSLHQDGQTISVANACEIARQTAIGLQYIYEQGMIHRDIKPSNLIIDRNGVVRILDLGLARYSDSFASKPAMTETGQLMGSIDFMAPEQARDSRRVNILADIFSLGATCFKLLSGRTVLGDQLSAMDKVVALSSGSTPDVSECVQHVPDAVCNILQKMLEWDATQRYQEPNDVALALEPYCENADLRTLVQNTISSSYHATISISKIDTPVDGRWLEESPSELVPLPILEEVEKESSTSPTGLSAFKTEEIVQRWEKDQSSLADKKRPSSNPFWKWSFVGSVATMVLLAVVITISTNGGEIRIECSDPNLEVEIVRNKTTAETWGVGQLAEYTWFRSGDYEVRIPGNADGRIELENNKFSLSRRGRQIVVIEVMHNDILPLPDIRDTWKFDAPKFRPNERSVDILTSADWKWTEAKPFEQAINDGISINLPASPSLTPDGLHMMFGRYEAALTWHWLIAGRETLSEEFRILHELPQTFQVDRRMGLHDPVIVSDSEARGQDGVASNTDLYLHELTKESKWREVRVFDNVNSAADEDCPVLSANGLSVVYGRRSDESGTMDLWMATRKSVDAPFEAPHILSNGINGPLRESSPTLSYDELLLIYHSTALTENHRYTLWMATRQNVDEPFANPQPVFVGDPNQFQLDPALALNGRLLVFRQRPQVVSGLQSMVDNQLYYVERVPSGAVDNVRQVSPVTEISASFQALPPPQGNRDISAFKKSAAR